MKIFVAVQVCDATIASLLFRSMAIKKRL